MSLSKQPQSKSSQAKPPKLVLIIGSGPDALRAKHWNCQAFTSLVAINNAWQIRDDWDYLIHAGDFPEERHPQKLTSDQNIYTYHRYVPIQNQYGGFVYAGGTMTFTTAYWALGELKPDIICFVGCDMVYQGQQTHFYGKGEADPLRDDMTLQNLEAKAQRFQVTALENQCLCLNLSALQTSRLVFPRCTLEQLPQILTSPLNTLKAKLQASINWDKVKQAKQKEKDLAYFIESGEYWHHLDQFDPNKLAELDKIWQDSLITKAETQKNLYF